MTPPDTCKVCGCPPPRTLPGNADDYSPCAACSGVHIAYWRDRVKGLQADLDVERAALTEACYDVDELTEDVARFRERADIFEARLEQATARPIDWQPAETAPRDGRVILAAWHDHGPVRVQYRTYHENRRSKKTWRDPETGHKMLGFTHWAPLPNMPPKRGDDT